MVFWLSLFSFAWPASAQDLGSVIPNFSEIFSDGETEVLLSGYAWHDPASYDSMSLRRDNAFAWGAGLARSLDRPDGASELVFGQVFSDSEREAEYTVGYSKTWNANVSDQFRVGVGYSAGLTERPDIFKGIPAPFVLPTLTARLFNKIDIYVAYIPPLPKSVGVKGDVAMIFGGIRF